MSASREVAAWVERWAQQARIPWRDVNGGKTLLLPDSRQVYVSARDGKFCTSTSLPLDAQSWSPERLLRYQFGIPFIINRQPSTSRTSFGHNPQRFYSQMRATLPLEGFAEQHAAALLDAVLNGRSSATQPTAARRKDLAVVRQVWEREHGGLALRERAGALSLRCRLPHNPLPIEVMAEPTAVGVRLRSDIVAEPFVQPECAAALHRYLLTVNAHVTLGGFALSDDGSPTFCVTLPAPVSGAHVTHGMGALFACYERFAYAVKAMAMNLTVASFWIRLNPEEKGGEIDGGSHH